MMDNSSQHLKMKNYNENLISDGFDGNEVFDIDIRNSDIMSQYKQQRGINFNNEIFQLNKALKDVEIGDISMDLDEFRRQENKEENQRKESGGNLNIDCDKNSRNNIVSNNEQNDVAVSENSLSRGNKKKFEETKRPQAKQQKFSNFKNKLKEQLNNTKERKNYNNGIQQNHFIKNMIDILPLRQKEKLKSTNLELIEDLASSMHYQKNQNRGQFLRFFISYIEDVQTFRPNSQKIVFFQSISLAFSIYHLILAPLILSFDISMHTLIRILSKEISFVVFSIQIIIKFNLGYYTKSGIQTRQLQIIQKYLISQLWIDIFTLYAIYSYDQNRTEILILPFMLRLITIKDGINQISEIFLLQQKYRNSYKLTSLLFKAVLIAHYSACIFHYIAIMQSELSDTWLTQRNIYHASWSIRYLDSFYYSLITMNTVGYGDIVPISANEQLFTIMMTIIACGFFAYCVNMVGSIFQQIQNREAMVKQEYKFMILNQIYVIYYMLFFHYLGLNNTRQLNI